MANGQWRNRTEAELVVEAQYGDLAAFDELVVRYRAGAVIIARQVLKSHDRAEDAVQDSFLSAYKALPQLAEPGSFAHWLGAIVRHRAIRLSQGAERQCLPLDELILAHAPSIAASVESRHRDKTVRCAIAELSDDLRVPLELYYLQQWSVGQISEFLDLPATTIKWRLHTGRRKLRPALSEQLGEQLEEPNGTGD